MAFESFFLDWSVWDPAPITKVYHKELNVNRPWFTGK